MTPFERIIRPGLVSVEGRKVSLFCRVKFDGKRLSISGVEGPRLNGNCAGSCGQIEMHSPDIVEYAPGWSQDTWERFLAEWRRWHLNDMRAGCEHQRAEGWTICPSHWPGPVTADTIERTRRELRESGVGLVRGEGRHYYCTDPGAPAEPRCAGNVQPLCKPCPACGYKYGTAWLHEDVPADVLTFLEGLPVSDTVPAWV